MNASNLRECAPVEISDSDVMAAMKSMQGHLYILIPAGLGAAAMLDCRPAGQQPGTRPTRRYPAFWL